MYNHSRHLRLQTPPSRSAPKALGIQNSALAKYTLLEDFLACAPAPLPSLTAEQRHSGLETLLSHHSATAIEFVCLLPRARTRGNLTVQNTAVFI